MEQAHNAVTFFGSKVTPYFLRGNYALAVNDLVHGRAVRHASASFYYVIKLIYCAAMYHVSAALGTNLPRQICPFRWSGRAL